MTREIKFRAWNKVWGMMSLVDKIEFEEGKPVSVSVTIQASDYDHKGEWEDYEIGKDIIPQQFTGLKDVNGVEIYEGDIVRNKREEFITVVEYYGGAFRCESEGMPLSLYIDECYGDKELNNQLEVVGNVYESKHLINNTEK